MAKNKKLSVLLLESRHKLGLTQVQFAQKAGIYSNTYARIERGEQKPEIATLKKLAKVSGISLEKLLDAWS